MKRILISIITVLSLAFTSFIFAEEAGSDFVETFIRKCMNEYDMISIKKCKGDEQCVEGALEMNKMMTSMIEGSAANWYEMKQKWVDAKENDDYETIKNTATYCNQVRIHFMDVCPKYAKKLPVLKVK